MNNKVVVGLVQMSGSEDPAQNLEKSITHIRSAAGRGAKIVCLQELFKSRYFCQKEDAGNFGLAEPIPGPTTEALSQIAKKEKVVVIAPIFEKRTDGIYHNSVVVIDVDGSVVGKYRKMHIPDDPLYYEKFYFTPGDIGFQAFQTRYAKIGVLICWDQWFPEGARLTALAGAQIIFYPTAIGWHPKEKKEFGQAQLQAWETIQRGHAIANGIFVAAANRVGREDGLEFWGNSFVVDPFGKIIAKAPSDKEEVLVVSCDLGQIIETRQSWPFLRDRRIDAYGDISKRFVD